MYQLNLPAYQFSIKKQNNKFLIFDAQRKRYVALTPEEWVRQHLIRFLIEDLHYPAALLAVESQIDFNGMKKRCDAILYNNRAQPALIIEVKAPHVAITQEIFDQVAVYNAKLEVEFFIISNGMEHYFCFADKQNNKYDVQTEIPVYASFLEMTSLPSERDF